ncbi:MAG TPA: hypothetical protein VGM91_19290 [Conexibacter sp.]
MPEVTVFFWIIKILATTVGETASDYLNETLGFGLHNTIYVMGAALIVILVVQFRTARYIPLVYWLTVVLISIVGTQITDNLTDGYNVPLTTSTLIFAALLAATFTAWFASERTLSIHTIRTRRRESFYWLTILFTFALGTAAGDLLQEKTGWSLAALALLWPAAIGLVTGAHFAVKQSLDPGHRRQAPNAVLAFWLAYIMTRPLGASLGDLLTTPTDESPAGLGLGTNQVSIVFAVVIVGLVAYLTVSKRDEPTPPARRRRRWSGNAVAQLPTGCASIVASRARASRPKKALLAVRSGAPSRLSIRGVGRDGAALRPPSKRAAAPAKRAYPHSLGPRPELFF